MSVFEYVSVLTSIVIGLGIAHLLRGVAGLIQHPSRYKTYWVHLIWVAFMFFQAIFWWWWEFAFEELKVWTFHLYLFVLIFAFIIYLLCALLFPSDLEGYSGYEQYFISRRFWFFGLLAVYFVVDIGDTLFKGMDYLVSLGPQYPASTVILVTGCMVAAYTAHRGFQAVFALVALGIQVLWAFSSFGTIG